MSRVDLKKKFIREYRLFSETLCGRPLFFAVSGGKDSTALAHVALSLREKLPPLHFLHVNYHLRIPDSDREESFLREWAGREGVPIHVKRIHPSNKPKNLQDWARRERYQFFHRVIHEIDRGSGVLCLAHHQDDQVETILMRLMTGSGLKALGGMRVLEKNAAGILCFRPFLEVPAPAIASYVKAHRLEFHQDRSNDELAYLRNRLRHRILPLLEAENPRAPEALILLGQKARAAQEALEVLARDWLTRHGPGPRTAELPRPALGRLPPALRTAVVEDMLRRQAIPTRNLGKILNAVENTLSRPRLTRSIPLAHGYELKLSLGSLRIQRMKGALRRGAGPRKP